MLSWLVVQVSLSAGSLEVVGTAYRADVPFPQFLHLWSEGWALKTPDGEPLPYAGPDMPLGAYLHAFIRNNSTTVVHATDVRLDGISLTEAIAFSDRKTANLYPASIHFATLPKAEIERLVAAGEPVWWKVDPPSLRPGGFAEVTIRLRRAAKAGATQVEVVATNALWQARVQTADTPRFASISFSSELDRVYCYVRHAQRPEATPVRVLLDGRDVTVRTAMAADKTVDLMPLVIQLEQPLTRGSFHLFQAICEDGVAALAGARAWSEEFVYGMWGYINQGQTAQERVDYFLTDLKRHNVNVVMESYGKEVAAFLSGESGVENARATGIRAMRNQPGAVLNPVYYFLTDEPDAHDFAVSQLPPTQRLGVLGQDLVRRSRKFREQDPWPPHLLNVDNTYKPENWYMYSQLADVYCADPYYQEQQRIVWNDRPAWAASFVKPLYVLGAATICNWACAPKPLHLILNSVRHDAEGGSFRFATPSEKTVELFYALGAGAKGFSYWWYTPYGEFHGCGSRDPAGVALWQQIGLLGAQVRTAGPLLTRSQPASVSLKATSKLWTRTLLAGTDSLILLAVNENLASDRLGTVVVPLPKAVVTLKPPAWLKTKDVFEIAPEGPRDANWTTDGDQLIVRLNPLEVARMVVLTGDTALRQQLEELHRARFAANVKQLTAGPSQP